MNILPITGEQFLRHPLSRNS
uniref:Uncharacterized protein n=1 Tax=Rhizophora mucronata TaxID=61149 RepID=A0A2P2Q0Z5_RHIMU